MVLEGGGMMPAFRCSCGEILLLNDHGITVCWFCRNEFNSCQVSIVPINYEAQKSRPFIKSAAVPVKRIRG